MSRRYFPIRLVGVVILTICSFGMLSSCVSMGRILNLEASSCTDSLSEQLTISLIGQGEKSDEAKQTARHSVHLLQLVKLGKRPFGVSTRDADYTYFIENSKGNCVLRLLSIRKGFWRYSNNLTFIDTRIVPECLCED